MSESCEKSRRDPEERVSLSVAAECECPSR